MTGVVSEIVEKYQIAGLDERERGFNRLAELERIEGGYRAMWHYESAVVITPARGTAADALQELIRSLHERGYTQLRTRACFRGQTYLGTQELWVEHLDPTPSRQGFLHRLLDRFRPGLGRTRTAEGPNSKD
jgi:hypothetical protein